MGFIKRTFDFIGKHILLIIPMFLVSLAPQALAYIVTGEFSTGVLIKSQDLVLNYVNTVGTSKGWLEIMGGIGNLITENFPKFGMMIGILIATAVILRIFIIPGVYGAINHGLSDKKLTVSQYAGLFYKKTGKYLLFLLCSGLYWFFWSFAGLIILLLVAAVGLAIQPIAGFLIMLASAFFVFAFIYLSLIIILWYPAIAVENLRMEQALRKSIKIMHKILPVILMTYVIAYLAYLSIMAIFTAVTASQTGQEIASVFLSVLMTFFLMVYQMVVYKSYLNAEKQAYLKILEFNEEEKRKKQLQEPQQPEE